MNRHVSIHTLTHTKFNLLFQHESVLRMCLFSCFKLNLKPNPNVGCYITNYLFLCNEVCYCPC